MALLAQLRLHGLDRLRDHPRERDGLALELDTSLGDTPDIEQIVDQASQVRGLAFDHVGRQSERGCPARAFATTARRRC